jgi:hypothetical protein
MQSMILMLRRCARQLAVCVALAASVLAPVSAMAQTGTVGPGGVNVGFDFNWGNSTGYTASFIVSSTTVSNCSPPGPVTGSTAACSFVFTYSVGGTAQTPVASGGTYETWNGANGATGVFCGQRTGATTGNAPLTLFNCFNSGSFGQIFVPSTSGALGGVTMRMTCLNPAGTPPTGLVALIYQMTNSGNGLPTAPIAQVPVDLSTCPTLTSWNGHTFAAGDFATIPLNFTGVTVTAGNVYGVYFGGLTPGSAPPGLVVVRPLVPAPTLNYWSLLALATLLAVVAAALIRRHRQVR